MLQNSKVMLFVSIITLIFWAECFVNASRLVQTGTHQIQANVGEELQMECSVEDGERFDPIYWKKRQRDDVDFEQLSSLSDISHKGLSERNEEVTESYKVEFSEIGNIEKFNFVIKKVTAEDVGTYMCELVVEGESIAVIYEVEVTATVDAVTIFGTTNVTLKDNTTLQAPENGLLFFADDPDRLGHFTCVVEGGYHTVTVESLVRKNPEDTSPWTFNNDVDGVSVETSKVTEEWVGEVSGLQRFRRVTMLTVSKIKMTGEYDNGELVCKGSTTDTQQIEDVRKLTVFSDPEIDMKKCEVKVSAPIGGKGVLECQFHVNPAVTRQHVSWHGESTEKDYTTWSMQNIGQNVFVAVLTLEDLAEADERYQSYKLSVQSVLSDTVASVTINLAEGEPDAGEVSDNGVTMANSLFLVVIATVLAGLMTC